MSTNSVPTTFRGLDLRDGGTELECGRSTGLRGCGEGASAKGTFDRTPSCSGRFHRCELECNGTCRSRCIRREFGNAQICVGVSDRGRRADDLGDVDQGVLPSLLRALGCAHRCWHAARDRHALTVRPTRATTITDKSKKPLHRVVNRAAARVSRRVQCERDDVPPFVVVKNRWASSPPGETAH